jgi:hypothetical protein
MQFRQQRSSTSTKREAPGEYRQPATRVQFAGGAIQHSAAPTPLSEHEDDFDAPGEKGVRFRDAPFYASQYSRPKCV